MLLIDFGLLLALSAIAGAADRFWPIWLAAFQLVAVAAHGVTAYNPEILPVAYWWIVGKIAYPMFAIFAIGTRRLHRRTRAGLKAYDWTHQRQRAAYASVTTITPASRSGLLCSIVADARNVERLLHRSAPGWDRVCR